MRVGRTSPGAALLMMLLLGCSDRDGIVEVSWQVEDASLERLYPLGFESDTCELSSASTEQSTGARYDLRVRLTIAFNTDACAADHSTADCQVIEPILFPCNRFRGTALDVPPSAEDDESDPGYLMVVEPMIDPTDAEPFVASSTCIASPGPRVRRVRAGRITDLEVYQFIVLAIEHDEGQLLDIEACRPP